MDSHSMLGQSRFKIQEEINHLALMADQAILDGVHALVERDENLARQVGAHDIFLNQARLNIEETCYAVLANPQPVAFDRRFVVGVVNVVTNLERIGDHAAGIARLTLRMNHIPNAGAIQHIPLMAATARELVDGAVKAFISQDHQLAENIVRRDREVDELYEQVYQELADLMVNNHLNVEPAMSLMWAAHNLESVGDRAVNICERTIYVVTGDLKEFG